MEDNQLPILSFFLFKKELTQHVDTSYLLTVYWSKLGHMTHG